MTVILLVLTIWTGAEARASATTQAGPTTKQAESMAAAFFQSYRTGDVPAMMPHFADAVLFVGDLKFLGEQTDVKGHRETTRDALTAAFTRMFARVGREKWSGAVALAKPALVRPTADGRYPGDMRSELPASFARSGDLIYELKLPGEGLHDALLFVLRPIGGQWKIVAHWADY
jgi:hypothetical protein